MIYKTLKMYTEKKAKITMKLEPMEESSLRVKSPVTEDGESILLLDKKEMQQLVRLLQEAIKYEEEETV